MRFPCVAVTVTALLIALPYSAPAQASCTGNPCTAQVTASATVNDVLRLTLSSASVTLGTPIDTDLDAGFKDVAGPTASVKSNRPWHVDVTGAAATFTYAGALTDPNKPSTDLLWGTVSGTYGNDLSSSAVLFSGATGTGSASQAIFFRTLWSWTAAVPGSYSVVINFTIAAP
jgi:hypothetical protein